VASHSPRAAEDSDGQVNMIKLTKGDVTMAALDVKTGKPVWKQTPDLRTFTQIVYLCYANETLVAFGARNHERSIWHNLIGFDARSGTETWRQTNDTGWGRGGGHGEQVKHPVIVGKTLYAERHAYDLATGKLLEDWTFDYERSGCGTVTASASCLFYRDRHPTMFELAGQRQTKLSRVNRPGCWVNIIPAAGLVVVPEGSSGCSCGFPMQTSIAFAPASDVAR